MSNLVADAPYIEAYHVPVNKFTVKQCKSWLAAHGSSFKSKDRASLLQQLIALAKSNEVSPPQIVGPCGCPHQLVEDVIVSLNALVCACIGPLACYDGLPDAVDCYIKLFLSAVNELEKKQATEH
jgi:ferredoxin-thioredoxin reductase catalytic subunit